MKKRGFIILIVLFFSFFTPTVFAADVHIVGKVITTGDMPVPFSKILFTNTSSKERTPVIADPVGIYSVVVPTGDYTVSVTSPNGKTEIFTRSMILDSVNNFVVSSPEMSTSRNKMNEVISSLGIRKIGILLGVFLVGISMVLFFLQRKK